MRKKCICDTIFVTNISCQIYCSVKCKNKKGNDWKREQRRIRNETNGQSTHKHLSEKQRREIIQMYEEGHKLEYIAALYGVRREYPSKLALRRGSPMRMPSMGKKHAGKDTT